MSAYYDVAQVCQNGHVINSSARESPERNKPYCSECGKKTITACPACNSPIQGHYNVPGVVAIGFQYHPPAYCHQCGAPYPWTAAKLQAAHALAEDQSNLNDRERQELSTSLDDLVTNTPMTKVSAGRFKRLVAKAGPQAADAFRELLVDIASETAKKILWPGGP
jgi:hypothetical protein